MSAMTPQQLKLLEQAERKLFLEQQNKEAAKLHLLAVQAYLAKTTPQTKK
jgi:hypothetical protein